jgi:methylase of polypeptide subunit release factors
MRTGSLAPLESVTAAALAPLRTLLAEFTEPAVCRRTGFDSIYDFRSIREGRTQGVELNDGLDLLIRLFLDVENVDRAAADALLGAGDMRLLESLGFVTSDAADGGRYHPAFLLYPTASLWIASDLNIDPDNPAETALPDDAVYPAISKNTRHFLSSLPKTPCDNFLEMCAGTGIAALVAAKYAEHTWAADITDRATAFARFNAVLNGIENCTAVQGDLYEAVPGQTFDRIVAHPPYMPSLEQKYIFRDGGDDGEQITRRILAGLSEHLRAGGRFYCTCMATERTDGRLEDRIRAMLGPHGDEFDLLLITFRGFEPTDYYLRQALEGRASLQEVVQRHEIFQSLAVEQLIYCSMVIERHAEKRPAYTARRQAGQGLGTKEVDRLMHWKAASVAPDALARLADSRIVASSHVRLRVDHTLQGDRWAAQDCVLATVTPFFVEAKCPPWTATLVARCDGQRTTREHLEFLKSSGAVPPDAPEPEFAQLVRSLIDGGLLHVVDA